jgi:integrase
VEAGRLEADSRRYHKNGWQLLEQTKIAALRMDQISKDEVEKLKFPGSASNGNNALRGLRRMYSKAKEHKMIFEVPDFALFKEHSRSLRLDDEAESRLSAVADQPLKDIIVVMRDTVMRNAGELYCMLVENVDFDAGTIFTPDSKTESGRRFIPMSSRVKQIIEARCEGRSEGWVWMSRYKGKHIGEGMVYRQWVRARQTAELPGQLVLYCARHDFGSFENQHCGAQCVFPGRTNRCLAAEPSSECLSYSCWLELPQGRGTRRRPACMLSPSASPPGSLTTTMTAGLTCCRQLPVCGQRIGEDLCG